MRIDIAPVLSTVSNKSNLTNLALRALDSKITNQIDNLNLSLDTSKGLLITLEELFGNSAVGLQMIQRAQDGPHHLVFSFYVVCNCITYNRLRNYITSGTDINDIFYIVTGTLFQWKQVYQNVSEVSDRLYEHFKNLGLEDYLTNNQRALR